MNHIGGTQAMITRHALHRLTAGIISAAMVVGMSGCSSDAGNSVGTGRSVQSFCSTYNSEKTAYTSKYAKVMQPNSSNPSASEALMDLILGVQSLGDAQVILTKLDQVAPPDIEPDVRAVLDSWNQMTSTMGDEAKNIFNPTGMLGAVVAGMLSALASSGSWTRVGQYIQTHCGQP